jgi:type VI secretion system protein ImpH
VSRPLDELIACGTALPFVQLVAQLERLLGVRAGIDGDAVVQFAHDPALVFHARDVVAVTRVDADGMPPRVCITTAFAGLFGAVSPLPTALIDDFAVDDEALAAPRALLDVFHHRLVSLFYRGLRALDGPISPDAPARAWVLALCGLMPGTATSVTGLADAQVLALAPLLVACPPNAERLRAGLAHLLADLLDGATISVASFTGARVALDERTCARLGTNLQLGRHGALGTHVLAPAAAIALHIAQLSFASYARLRPGGDRWSVLCAVTRLLTPESIDVTLALSPASAPPLRLGSAHARLGWDGWLGSGAQPSPLRCTIPAEGARRGAREAHG